VTVLSKSVKHKDAPTFLNQFGVKSLYSPYKIGIPYILSYELNVENSRTTAKLKN
jgi:hypothetical protein